MPFGRHMAKLGILDGGKFLKILLLILTESTNVIYRQTDTAWRHRPHLCIASRGKNYWLTTLRPCGRTFVQGPPWLHAIVRTWSIRPCGRLSKSLNSALRQHQPLFFFDWLVVGIANVFSRKRVIQKRDLRHVHQNKDRTLISHKNTW